MEQIIMKERDIMAYDFEKYRDKREKVLGVRKRGVSFGTLAAVISVIIILGLGIVVVPKSIAYFNTRHLDDAIYKLQNTGEWHQELITAIGQLAGVKNIETDANSSRIIVTFDKSITGTNDFNAFFKSRGFTAILLNQVSHTQRLHTLKQEAKFEG
jgi:copper chaperone CopZ